MKVLVCGGAGYIGSHTAVALLERGHEVLVYDNFCNSSRIAPRRIEEVAKSHLQVVEGDIRDRGLLGRVLDEGFDVVVHFAALKAVGDSCERPLEYFDNNISGTISLLQAMKDSGLQNLVFSSSATVYGSPDAVPVPESAPVRVTNPYGRTKLVMEQLIEDLCTFDTSFSAVILRYFNPAGAHPSGRIGEDPGGIPNNLMPFISQVAAGLRPSVKVFGGDYPTPDGTGVRDYIHVMDLADAHVKAVEQVGLSGLDIVNLGSGRGYSVLEVIKAFENASGRVVPYEVVPRRSGDVAEVWADPSRAATTWNWRAVRGLAEMCEDAWRWQSTNPSGYCEE